MITLVYENPQTRCREMWQDGVLLAHLSESLILSKGFKGHRSIPFPLSSGGYEFIAGRVVSGDIGAMSAPLPTLEPKQ